MTHFTFLFSSNKGANYPKFTLASAKYTVYVKFGSEQIIVCQNSVLWLGFANATPKFIDSCKYVLNIFKHFRENSITISGHGNEKTGKISLNS